MVRLWELYAILMCQACWMVRATAVLVHNVYSIVIDIITLLLSYVYILLDLYFDFMILFSVPN